MPITVAHQPSARAIGDIAYGTGRAQRADQLRREAMARREAQAAREAQLRNAEMQNMAAMERVKLQQAEAMKRDEAQRQAAADRALAQEQFDLFKGKLEQKYRLERDEAERKAKQEAALEARRWQIITDPKLQQQLGRLAKTVGQIQSDASLSDSERAKAMDMLTQHPLYNYLPLYLEQGRKQTMQEEWEQSHVELPDGRLAYKSGPDRMSISMPPKEDKPEKPPELKPLDFADQLKLEQAAWDYGERRAEAIMGDAMLDTEQVDRQRRYLLIEKHAHAYMKRQQQERETAFAMQYQLPDVIALADTEDRMAIRRKLMEGVTPEQIRIETEQAYYDAIAPALPPLYRGRFDAAWRTIGANRMHLVREYMRVLGELEADRAEAFDAGTHNWSDALKPGAR